MLWTLDWDRPEETVRQLPESVSIIAQWSGMNTPRRQKLLQYLPKHHLTEDLFCFLLKEGNWSRDLPHLLANEEFDGEVYPLAVGAFEKVYRQCRERRAFVPVEEMMAFLRAIAERGGCTASQIDALAQEVLSPVSTESEGEINVIVAGLLLDFPGLNKKREEEILSLVEENLGVLLGEPDSEMEEYIDDPFFRLVHHEKSSLSTLKAIAAAPNLGLAHDEMLRDARVLAMSEVIALLIPHTDSTRLLRIARHAHPSAYKQALWQLVEKDPRKAALAMGVIPEGVSFTEEELLPLLSSSEGELRLKAMLLLSRSRTKAEMPSRGRSLG